MGHKFQASLLVVSLVRHPVRAHGPQTPDERQPMNAPSESGLDASLPNIFWNCDFFFLWFFLVPFLSFPENTFINAHKWAKLHINALGTNIIFLNFFS